MTACLKEDKFQKGTNLKGWLVFIMRNMFINKWHRSGRKVYDRTLSGKNTTPSGRGATLLDYLVHKFNPHPPTPENIMSDKQFDPRLEKALEELNADYRDVIMLCDLNDMSYKEASEMLDIPIGTVMSRLYRGRKKMRPKLAQLALEHNIIKDTSVFMNDETNKTRKSLRQ